MLTAMEYLREVTEETDKNSCEAKERPDQEVKKNNQGTSATEMPDMTTTTSKMPENTADIEVIPAWPAVQKKENDGNLAKLKVFGEKRSTKVHKHDYICAYFFFEASRSVSEKKVLPSAVLFAGLVYAAVAVAFYFE